MTRDEVKAIVEGIGDDALKKLLDINSADIGKAKKEYEDIKAQLATETKTRKELEAEIGKLKEVDVEGKDKKIKELEDAIAQREAADIFCLWATFDHHMKLHHSQTSVLIVGNAQV